MNRYKKLLAVLLCIAVLITAAPKITARAEALTVATLGAIALGVGAGLGIVTAFSASDASGVNTAIENSINQYLNGQTISEKFGEYVVRQNIGVLTIGSELYNSILDFWDWMADGNRNLPGEVDGVVEGEDKTNFGITNTGYSCEVTGTGASSTIGFTGYVNGTTDVARTYNPGGVAVDMHPLGWQVSGIEVDGNGNTKTTWTFHFMYTDMYKGAERTRQFQYSAAGKWQSGINVSLGGDVDYSSYQPQRARPDQEWQGDFSGTPGFAEPPTDLPDFLSRIPVAVADNQLVVTDELVESGGSPPSPTPSPTPSPRPTPAPVPEITIAQKIAAILGEIMGLIGLTGDTPLTEEQQQQIADTAQNIEESVKDVTQNITDTITQQRTETSYDIQEQTQKLTDGQQQIKDAIQDQTQTLTDTLPDIKDAIQDQTQTLTDTLPDIKDAIQDQTQDITDIKDAIEDITEVPDDFEPQKHPLPRGVFPFCIPFDLHDIIVALDAEPVTPEVHIPFRVPSIMGMNFGLDYTFDLDLHDFDGLAQVLRTLEFIAFGVGLLFVTGKVIKW